MAGWCGARTTSTREPLLGMPVGTCHAVPGRSVFPPLEPGAVRLSEITAFCRLAPRLLHEPRRTSGTVGGAHERLTPFIRLENCSTESVLQPQSPTIDVNCSSAPSTARTVLGLAHPSRPVCWMEPTSLPKPRRLHGRHVGYYTGGGKCASCQALAVELGWLDTVHSGPEPDGLRGDDAPDAVPTADKMPDATGGTMSIRTGRCYLAASLTGNARSARRPRCGSAKAATRTSAPQACLPGGPVSAGWVSGGGRCYADRSSAYYRF